MKKTFLIALAGILMFAFTQCGGGNSSKDNADNASKGNTEKIDDDEDLDDEDLNDEEWEDEEWEGEEDEFDYSGFTEEFRDTKVLLDKMIKFANEASSCEEMDELGMKLLAEAIAMGEKNYAEDEKITPDEEKILREISEAFAESMSEKRAALGCDDEKSGNDDDWNWDDDEDDDWDDDWEDDWDEDDDDWVY